jgi:diaminopimelate epimerase
MPGGNIAIEIGKDFSILMTGPVTKVCSGQIADEIFEKVIY